MLGLKQKVAIDAGCRGKPSDDRPVGDARSV